MSDLLQLGMVSYMFTLPKPVQCHLRKCCSDPDECVICRMALDGWRPWLESKVKEA